jgi:hypothetical protein
MSLSRDCPFNLEDPLVVPEVEDAALGEGGEPLLLLLLLDLLPHPVLAAPAARKL